MNKFLLVMAIIMSGSAYSGTKECYDKYNSHVDVINSNTYNGVNTSTIEVHYGDKREGKYKNTKTIIRTQRNRNIECNILNDSKMK